MDGTAHGSDRGDAPDGGSVVRSLTATVEELHRFDPFAGRTVEGLEVWVMRPLDDAVVLGSQQSIDVVEAEACRRSGLAVVRRRSGGGAVLVRRGGVAWIDVVAPHGFGPDDVRGSMIWIGRSWADVVGGLVNGCVAVHDGGLVRSGWSELVCFAGIGPGEVLVDGRKFVGLSQRRTRHGIRVQGMVHLRSSMMAPSMDVLRTVLRPPVPEGAPAEPHAIADLDVDSVARRLVTAIAGRRHRLD